MLAIALSALTSFQAMAHSGLNQCLKDLCGSPSHFPNLLIEANIDNQLTVSRDGPLRGMSMMNPLDTKAASRLDLLEWLEGVEPAPDSNDPYFPKSLMLSQKFVAAVQKLESSNGPQVTAADILKLMRIARMTKYIYVLRSRDIMTSEQIAHFMARWNRVLKVSLEVLRDNYFYPESEAKRQLESLQFIISGLSECSYSDLHIRWKSDGLTSGLDDGKLIESCAQGATLTPYRQARAEKYDGYLKAVNEWIALADSLDKLSLQERNLKTSELIALLPQMTNFWKPRGANHAASNIENRVYVARQQVRWAYYGDFALAHEIAHRLLGAENDGPEARWQRTNERNKCLVGRNYRTVHRSEDSPDHFASQVVKKMYPHIKSPASCINIEPIAQGASYEDKEDLSALYVEGQPHSKPQVRVLFEALDNNYLPASCHAVIKEDRLNRSCTPVR